MPPFPVRTIQIPMKVAMFRPGPDGYSSITCLGCNERLDLLQPGEDLPDRLMGVCPHCCDNCGSWHIIDYLPEKSEAMIVLLPSSLLFHEALAGASNSPLPANGDPLEH
jgi:hypothetical protein